MKDRIPGAPGKYNAKLPAGEFQKMQNGKPFAITLTRDDAPIVAGTPYNKAAVLPDDLAAKLCPGIADPSPADAFAALEKNKYPAVAKTLLSENLNEYRGTEAGVYFCTKLCAGAPFQSDFYLEVNGNYQRATRRSTRGLESDYGEILNSKIKCRFYINGAWSEWSEPYVSIEATGTSGSWTYRKWSNGVVECWSTQTLVCNDDTEATITFPFCFTEEPYVIVSASHIPPSVFATGMRGHSEASSPDIYPNFDMYKLYLELRQVIGSGTIETAEADCSFNVYCTGKWK